jgi:ketosteroid isomerase-like protein
MPDAHPSNIEAVRKEISRIIESGDLEALRGLCAPDAQIWHNTDQADKSVDETIQYLKGLVGATSRRWFSDVRVTPTPAGFVHQHYTNAVFPNGQEIRVATCVVITLEGDRIKRLEEYFDPSGTAAPHAG